MTTTSEESTTGSLRDRVCLVTGAAGGLGSAIARLFARRAATLYLCDTRPPEEAPQGATPLALDVTDEQAWQRALSAVREDHGRLDVLVNCAGLSGASSPERRFDPFQWDRLMAVNAKGPFLGTVAAWPLLAASGTASVVNISSISGLAGSRGAHPGYGASKAALTVFTKTMALEMAGDGIRVNSVHPGVLPVMSSAARDGDAGDTARAEADAIRARVVARNIPLGRLGAYDEIAQAVLFLADAETSSYMTGAELVVDGGFLAE